MTQKLKIIIVLLLTAFFCYSAPKALAACISGEVCGTGGNTQTAPTTTTGGSGSPSDTTSTKSCPAGEAVSSTSGDCAPLKKASDCAVRVDPNDPTQCAEFGNGCNGNTANTCLTKNPIVKDINVIVDFLAAAVGIVVIGTIILGGIQYSLAGDNSTATGAAKKRIMNGLIALVAFIFVFAFVQWLIPGGV